MWKITGHSFCVLRGDQSSNLDITDYEERLVFGEDKGDLVPCKTKTWEAGDLVRQSWNEVRRKPGKVSLPEKEERNEDSMRESRCSVFLSFLMHVTGFSHAQASQGNMRMYVCVFCYCV